MTPGADYVPDADVPYTEWWRRAVATVIDYIVIAGSLAILLNLLGLSTVEEDAEGRLRPNLTLGGIVLTIGLSTLYFAVPTARTGRTLGKVAMRCRVVRLDGTLLDPGAAFARALVYVLCVQTCVLGLVDGLWALWDPRRQTLHDKVAGTVVVDA